VSLTRGDNPDKQNKGMNKMTTLTSVIKKELKQNGIHASVRMSHGCTTCAIYVILKDGFSNRLNAAKEICKKYEQHNDVDYLFVQD
jgi:hypothetical protein